MRTQAGGKASDRQSACLAAHSLCRCCLSFFLRMTGRCAACTAHTHSLARVCASLRAPIVCLFSFLQLPATCLRKRGGRQARGCCAGSTSCELWISVCASAGVRADKALLTPQLRRASHAHPTALCACASLHGAGSTRCTCGCRGRPRTKRLGTALIYQICRQS